MKVVTVCGSMRFAEEMQRIALNLEVKKGYCVLQPVYEPNAKLDGKDLKKLAEAHFRKIELADAVYIVNIGGYVGQSVSKEIEYAKQLGKEVILHENKMNV